MILHFFYSIQTAIDVGHMLSLPILYFFLKAIFHLTPFGYQLFAQQFMALSLSTGCLNWQTFLSFFLSSLHLLYCLHSLRHIIIVFMCLYMSLYCISSSFIARECLKWLMKEFSLMMGKKCFEKRFLRND